MAEESLKGNKKPVFVTVYDRLYTMVTDGTYPPGSTLPPEPKLAKQLDVSRETLRKAMRLLEEDGLLLKIKGRGNFVNSQIKPTVSISSLSRLGNPIRKCVNVPLDEEVEIEVHIENTSEYEQKLFSRESKTALAIDRWYRSSGKVVAYSLTLAPIEAVRDLGMDISNKAKVIEFLENGVYGIAKRAQIRVKTTWVGQFISDRYVLNQNEELSLIQETLYGEDDTAPLLHTKHYILPDVCTIEISAM